MSSSSSPRPTKKAKLSSHSTSIPKPSWRETDCGTLLYLHDDESTIHQQENKSGNNNDKMKIVGFDLDGTLIRTKSGKTFATNELTDWELAFASSSSSLFASKGTDNHRMKSTMAKLATDYDRVVIFTNQEGIGKGKVDKTKWQTKVERVIAALGLTLGEVTVLASLSKKGNDYRKPHVGMWRFLEKKLLSWSKGLEPTQSLYVGDAAGRPKRGHVKKDFSCTDYKFALNLSMPFQTPEQLFLGSKTPGDLASLSTSNMGFQPKRHWKEYYENDDDDDDDGQSSAANNNHAMNRLLESCRSRSKPEILLLVGSPASGKSHTAHRITNVSPDHYVRINQDTLKTLAKCLDTAKTTLAQNKSAVIDNTNRDPATRKKYVDLAKSQQVSCRCVWIQTTKEESFHLNALRGATAGNDQRTVPDMVIHGYYKNMVEPDAQKEGFDEEVIRLPFTPGPFPSVDRKEAFFRFTL